MSIWFHFIVGFIVCMIIYVVSRWKDSRRFERPIDWDIPPPSELFLMSILVLLGYLSLVALIIVGGVVGAVCLFEKLDAWDERRRKGK